MTTVRRTLSPLIVLALAVLAALPWGLGDHLRMLPPFIPALAIYVLGTERRGAVPEMIAFIAGLSVDAMTQGPLGYWGLIYLFASFAAVVVPPPAGRVLAGWAMFVPISIALVLTAYVVGLVYAMALLPLAPFAAAVVLLVVAYPFAAILLAPLVRSRASPQRPLVRGGSA
ncbi:MAG: hypothetical protein AB7E80_05245 [Hyphomicrobiaceae bacterium]